MYVLSTEEYLSHHGRDGMKWGHRNGPPYPLPDAPSAVKKRKGAYEEKKKRVSLGEESRKRKIAKIKKQNAEIRAKNAKLNKKKKELQEAEDLKKRQYELKEKQKELKKKPDAFKPPKAESKPKKEPKPVEEKPKELKTKMRRLSTREIKKMSNAELKEYVDRLNLEKQLKEADRSVTVTGKTVAADILKASGRKSLESVATAVMTGVGKYAVKKLIAAAASPEIAQEIMGGGKQSKKSGND